MFFLLWVSSLNYFISFPFSSLKSDPENNSSYGPVQTHGKGDSHNTHVQNDCKKNREYKPHTDCGKQGNTGSKFHISCCAQSLSQWVSKRKNFFQKFLFLYIIIVSAAKKHGISMGKGFFLRAFGHFRKCIADIRDHKPRGSGYWSVSFSPSLASSMITVSCTGASV